MSTEYALPPEPPIGTVVHGKRWDYIRRDVDSPRRWAAGHPGDLMTIPAWTWGEVLNDGPVTVDAADTLPEWLCGRFGDEPWIDLTDDDRSYWEHEAAAVRRAVTRGGFKSRLPEPTSR